MSVAKDKVAAGIDAANQPDETPMAQLRVRLGSSGRAVAVLLPVDMTPLEMVDFMGWCGSQALPDLAKMRNPARARLVLPT